MRKKYPQWYFYNISCNTTISNLPDILVYSIIFRTFHCFYSYSKKFHSFIGQFLYAFANLLGKARHGDPPSVHEYGCIFFPVLNEIRVTNFEDVRTKYDSFPNNFTADASTFKIIISIQIYLKSAQTLQPWREHIGD